MVKAFNNNLTHDGGTRRDRAVVENPLCRLLMAARGIRNQGIAQAPQLIRPECAYVGPHPTISVRCTPCTKTPPLPTGVKTPPATAPSWVTTWYLPPQSFAASFMQSEMSRAAPGHLIAKPCLPSGSATGRCVT